MDRTFIVLERLEFEEHAYYTIRKGALDEESEISMVLDWAQT